MNDVFSRELKNKLKIKSIAANVIILATTYIYFFVVILLFIFKIHLTKTIFIIIFSIINFLCFSVFYVTLKAISYFRNLKLVIESEKISEYIDGVINIVDTYQITIDGLLYTQYAIKSDNEIKERIFYCLDEIDITNLVSKKVIIGLKNNIIYTYEVKDE